MIDSKHDLSITKQAEIRLYLWRPVPDSDLAIM